MWCLWILTFYVNFQVKHTQNPGFWENAHQTGGKLSFSKNGENMGVAFDDLTVFHDYRLAVTTGDSTDLQTVLHHCERV